MCFVSDYDGSSLGTTTRRARKPHTCEECNCRIEPGTRYLRHAFVFEGRAGDSTECLRCHRIRELIAERENAEGCHGDEAWAPAGAIAEYLEEHRLAYDAGSDALVGTRAA